MSTIDLANATPKPVQIPHDEQLDRRERAVVEIAAYASGYTERRVLKYDRYDTADGLDVLVCHSMGTRKPWNVAARIATTNELDTPEICISQSRSRILHTLFTWVVARAGEVRPSEPKDVTFDRVALPATASAPQDTIDDTECAVLVLNPGSALAWNVRTVGSKAHVALSLVDRGAASVGIPPWTALVAVDDRPDAIETAKRRLRIAMMERSIRRRAQAIARFTAEHRARVAASASA